MSSERFLSGVIIGGAIGALIGLLFAPRKGEETRQILREELENRFDQSVKEARSQASHLSDIAHDAAEQLRRKSHQITQELEDVGRETLEKLKSGLKTTAKIESRN